VNTVLPKTRLLAVASLLLTAVQAPAATPVQTDVAREQAIVREVGMTGTVTSPRSATLSPSVGGLVQQVEVDIGFRVQAGNLLLQLDPELESLALERSRATEAEARSALADARRRLEEAERLRGDNSIARTEVESRRAQAEMAAAALASAQADVRQRQAIVRRHAVRAPFDGVISQRYAELGEWVAPGDAVLDLVATDELRFDFRAPQEIFGLVSESTPVRIYLSSDPAQGRDGRIETIVPVNDPRARTFLVRATTPGEPDPDAAPGMSARATLFIDLGRRAVVVPRDALLRYPDGRTTVWAVQRSGSTSSVTESSVSTGLEFDGLIEIRDGLSAGTEVVTRGNEALQDGQAVLVR
jgi:membrane fusion protein (multidrug efflux system)